MNVKNFTRREAIQISLLTVLSTISGCKNLDQKHILAAFKGNLPSKFIRVLPTSWKFKLIDPESKNFSFRDLIKDEASLIAINDGWLSSLRDEWLVPFPNIGKIKVFDNQAKLFVDGFDKKFANKILPIAVSPWVMIFRNGENWFEEANRSWDVLLNSNLKDSIVLPNSPRLVISLAQKMSDPLALEKIRSQCNIYDDQNALNWLLGGKVSVVVLPLVSCWKSLISDPRLSAILPDTGAPLSWTVLVRSLNSTEVPIPLDWLEKSWNEPLLKYLISSGWIPPLDNSKLQKYRNYLGNKYGPILIPSQAKWDRCWSLPFLDEIEKIKLEKLWLNSS